jgi:hypothetical protein
MNEFNNGFDAMPENGFSAVSREELEQVEGGFFYDIIMEGMRQFYLQDVGVEAPMLPR